MVPYNNKLTPRVVPPPVRVLAWELTRACNLSCPYCRASAGERGADELTTLDALRALRQFSTLGKPLLIISGGEPLMRSDIFTIIDEADALGFPTALATNGTLVEHAEARRLAESGVRRVSISLDFPDSARHDRVRGAGAFDAALSGIALLREHGVPFQVNMTVGRENSTEIAAMLALARGEGAAAFHLFFVVDVGRARGGREGLPPGQYEAVLCETAAIERDAGIEMRVTCAPQYQRVRREVGVEAPSARTAAGCMAGRGFLFVSAVGQVKPCGYFDLVVGGLADGPLDVLWRESAVLQALRRTEKFAGCGRCTYRDACGGCRARAYSLSGDFLSADPACQHNL